MSTAPQVVLACSRGRVALAVSLVFLGYGCGPGAATPMPEPPSMVDLAQVGPPDVLAAVMGVDVHALEGRAGAVPANATVRVTNLDRTEAAYATTANSSGGFNIVVTVAFGEELRFDWALPDQHSNVPVDALFQPVPMKPLGFVLTPSARFDCVHLTPGYVLDFGASSADTLAIGLKNDCAGDLTLGAPRLRRGLPDFASSATAQTVARGSSVMLPVSFTRASAAAVEDTLLFDVTVSGTVIRYPVTLSASTKP